MSIRADLADQSNAPQVERANNEGQRSRDWFEPSSLTTASRRNLSNEAFGQDSQSFRQSVESMGQSQKKGTELAMMQFGELTLFDSAGDTKPASKPGEKPEKKETDEPDIFDQILKDFNDPAKKQQLAKEEAERRAKETKEYDEKAASRKPPKQGEPLDPDASKEGTKDYIKKLPDLDYKSVLKGHQVTLLGESHTDDAAKDHVAAYAKNMKESGATHFAVETITQSMQSTLDKYMKGDKEARKEIEKHIMDGWDKSYPGSGEKYMKMLDAVKDSGMKIVAMDINGHLEHNSKERAARDKAWSDTIAGILKDEPDAKVVAFGGSGHFTRRDIGTKSTNQFLKDDHKIDSQVLGLSGNRVEQSDFHDERLRERERNLQYRLGLYGEESQQDGRTLLVPLSPKGDPTRNDGIISFQESRSEILKVTPPLHCHVTCTKKLLYMIPLVVSPIGQAYSGKHNCDRSLLLFRLAREAVFQI